MTEREVKRNLGRRVRYTNKRLYVENAEYIFSGATIRRGDEGLYYQAELTDIHNGNSLLICTLEEVEAI